MAKKKSSRFIIPATFFKNKIIEEKLDVPASNLQEAIQKPNSVRESESDYTNANQNKSKIPPKPELEKPKILNRITTERKKSALSLSSLNRIKIEEEKFRKEKEKINLNKELPNDSFSEETFTKVWNEYIAELHKKGEKIFASILKADTPKIEGNTIFVTYPNAMMKTELLKVKPKVLGFLRKELNNYSIDFHITVNEENTKNFAYTAQEKYELLKEKNKAISLLKKTFNLEL